MRPSARTFAREWLWYLGSVAISALWVSEQTNGAPDSAFGIAVLSAIVGVGVYLGIGVIRLTIWAIRTMFPAAVQPRPAQGKTPTKGSWVVGIAVWLGMAFVVYWIRGWTLWQ